jgi:UDP-2-acetamido-2,6-beta-L-arabino-hexul-4-ose reductase
MPVTYEQLRVISDSRGYVFEPLLAKALRIQKNVHIVVSGPGVVRGNHYHLKGEETIAIMGPALVRFRENGQTKDMEIPEGQVYRFFFPPEIPHAIKNIGNRPTVLAAFNTIEHDPQNPDTKQEVLIE